MSRPAEELPVEPKLFRLIERYADDLDKGRIKPEDGLAPEISTFCLAFFQQFLHREVGLEITAIDDNSKRDAIVRRLRLGNDNSTLPTRRLILMFQDLCDLWPDISEEIYWTSESPLGKFHREFMIRLLRRIVEWAKAAGYEEIVVSASAAEQAFTAASMKL